eukprot:TRINITY_DN7884_c0_g1_i1.p1 TRINITY_DN7884_c0_g1~~TRINITY_DN7884_c0_g1_i1.p1  ORF type:complete len:254 (+),score=32.81 TRINITY_DN7884_c0_g1_i1:27-764(+)
MDVQISGYVSQISIFRAQATDCLKEIDTLRLEFDSWLHSFGAYLEFPKSKASDIAQLKANITELQDRCKLLEQTYLHKKAVNKSKYEQWVLDTKSLSDTKKRVEELKRVISELNERILERERIISEQSIALAELKEACARDSKLRKGQQEAMAWYSTVLGFRVEVGYGIKCIFTYIDRANPEREYSFTIRHSRKSNRYKLLDSNPCCADTEELVAELNKTNDLFRFIKAMREMYRVSSERDNCMR